MRHTPGPLVAVRVGLRWRVEAPNLESDAEPGDTFVLLDNLSESDARLFAEAPEMLALLKEAVNEDFGDGDYFESKARKLIAKAEWK